MLENEKKLAEEFLKEKLSEVHDENILEDLLKKMFTVDVSEVMVAFAKLHVEAALEKLLEDIPYLGITDSVSNSQIREVILNSYPLDKIK